MGIEQSELDDAVQQMQSYLEGVEVRQGIAFHQLGRAVSDAAAIASTVLLVVTLMWAGVPFHWWYVLAWLAFVAVKEIRRRSI